MAKHLLSFLEKNFFQLHVPGTCISDRSIYSYTEYYEIKDLFIPPFQLLSLLVKSLGLKDITLSHIQRPVHHMNQP